MFKKSVLFLSLISAALLVTAGILLHTQPAQASAATLPMSETSSCLDCHENRYYQHDTGNHYCLTDAAARCVDCHDGNPEAFEEKTAHVGLVSLPILNGDISRCQACHVTDAQAHVDTFATLAGFSESAIIAKQVQPSTTAQTGQPVQNMLNTKTVLGVTAILTVLAGMFVFCILFNKSCH